MWTIIFLFTLVLAFIFALFAKLTDSYILGIIALICATMTFLSSFAWLIDSGREEEAIYNHGIHQEDNGNWVFVQAVGHRSWTDYIYRCDKCGRIIEVGCEPENIINY